MLSTMIFTDRLSRRSTLLLGAAVLLLLAAGAALLFLRGGDSEEEEPPVQQVGDLTIHCLSSNVRPADDNRGLIVLEGEEAELLLASPHPLEQVRLDFESRATSFVEIGEGWEEVELLFRPDGSLVYTVRPAAEPKPVRAWPAFWASSYRYPLTFELPGGSRFKAVAVVVEEAEPAPAS